MNSLNLLTLSQLRGLNGSDLARMAGVSRQAVSLWFQQKTPKINLHSKHQDNLAHALGLTLDELSRPLPLYQDPRRVKELETILLWDKSYPSLAQFAIALCREELPALARVAQVYGLYQAEKIAGKVIWEKFLVYKKHMTPIARNKWEKVWSFEQNPVSN